MHCVNKACCFSLKYVGRLWKPNCSRSQSSQLSALFLWLTLLTQNNEMRSLKDIVLCFLNFPMAFSQRYFLSVKIFEVHSSLSVWIPTDTKWLPSLLPQAFMGRKHGCLPQVITRRKSQWGGCWDDSREMFCFLPRRWWEWALPSHVPVRKWWHHLLGYCSAHRVRLSKSHFHIALQSTLKVTLTWRKFSFPSHTCFPPPLNAVTNWLPGEGSDGNFTLRQAPVKLC